MSVGLCTVKVHMQVRAGPIPAYGSITKVRESDDVGITVNCNILVWLQCVCEGREGEGEGACLVAASDRLQ